MDIRVEYLTRMACIECLTWPRGCCVWASKKISS